MNQTDTLLHAFYSLFLVFFFSQKNAAQCPAAPNLQFVSEVASVPAENILTVRKDALGRPFLYAASKEGGLKVYSVANPGTPALVAQLAVSNWHNLHLMSVEQMGDRLYLALGNHFNQPLQPPGLAVVSVTDPAAPVVLGKWKGDFAEGGAGALLVDSGIVFLGAMYNGLLTLDASNPAQIKPIGGFLPEMNFPHGPPPAHADSVKFNVRAFALRGDTLFTCYDRGGLRVFDVSDLAQPTEIGRYCNETMTGFATAYNDVLLDNNLAYVSVDYLGVEVLDISHLGNISRLGWWKGWNAVPTNNPFVWAANDGHANELFWDEKCRMLFVATGKSDLFAVSVANPTAPVTCENYGGITNGIGTYGLGGSEGELYLAYIFTVIPFVSNWTGIKVLTYDNCTVPATVPANSDSGVSIAPNPSGSILGLFFEKTPAETCQVQVYDLAGALVFSKNIQPDRAGSVLRKETGLAAGWYVVVVREGDLPPVVLRWAVGR